MGAMGYVDFVMFFVFCALVVFLSFILDFMWSRILPQRIIHRIFVTPGIVVHECSHAVACLITGAKITEIKFFEPEGGHVTHGKPRIPVLGQVVISIAPLFGIPLFLFGLSLLFEYVPFLHCNFDALGDIGSVWDLLLAPFELLKDNFYTEQNWWFILYLYLALSLVTCLAPSGPDFRNCIIGIAVLFALGMIFLFIVNLINGKLDTDWNTPGLRLVIGLLFYAVGIGFFLELITLIISIPLFLLVTMIRRRA